MVTNMDTLDEHNLHPMLQEDTHHRFKALEGDRVVVRMEALSLLDGMRIEREIWEPLFGGDLMPMWDEVIPNTGEHVFLKGGSVYRMLFGGYVFDKKTGLADKSLRTDVDIVVPEETAMQRVRGSATLERSTSSSSVLRVEDLEVGFIASERIRELQINVLEELSRHSTNVTDQQTILALYQIVEKASPNDLMLLDSYFPYERMYLEMWRNSTGELEVIFRDPYNYMDDWGLRSFLGVRESYGLPFGFCIEAEQIDTPIPSVHAVSMHMFRQFLRAENAQPVVFTGDARNLAYTINSIPMYMRNECEGSMFIRALGTQATAFTDMAEVAYYLSKGQTMFDIEGGLYSPFRQEQVSVAEWFKEKAQLNFARASIGNIELAYCDMFLHLPMGGTISAEIGDYFEDYHQLMPPNNLLSDMLTELHAIDVADLEGSLKPLDSFFGRNISAMPHLRSALRYRWLTNTKYSANYLPMEATHAEGRPAKPYADVFVEAAFDPKDMSEVMAMVFLSLGWNTEDNRDSIESVISNWVPHGKLGLLWGTKKLEFELGLSFERISEEMHIGEEMIRKDSKAKYLWNLN